MGLRRGGNWVPKYVGRVWLFQPLGEVPLPSFVVKRGLLLRYLSGLRKQGDVEGLSPWGVRGPAPSVAGAFLGLPGVARGRR